MEELTTAREFADVHRTLTEDEYRLLEQDILANGCLDPIITWANRQGTILDGHNRYEICTKHKISFKVKALNLPDKETALRWIINHQLGRRHTNESQRAILAARIANLGDGEKKSGAHQCAPVSQADAAEEFNVSRRSVQYGSKVLNDGAKSLRDAVQSGDVPVTQAAAVAELPKAEQRKIVAKGPDAVAAAAKKQVAKKKAKGPSFDTAKLDKELSKDKKPGSVKKKFNDKDLDDLFGKLVRLMDQRWNEHGGHNRLYQTAVKALRDACEKWGEWKSWKGAL